jgi:ATP-dependent DNA helicase HFM1/MER3
MVWPSKHAVEKDGLTIRCSRPGMNTSKRRSDSSRLSSVTRNESNDEFEDSGLNDADLLQAASGMIDLEFTHIDNFCSETAKSTKRNTSNNAHQKPSSIITDVWQPRRLDNGKWACNHACKDKKACKHLCCREGVDKPPKAPKNWGLSAGSRNDDGVPKGTQKQTKLQKGQTTLSLTGMKVGNTANRPMPSTVESIDLTRDSTAIATCVRGSVPGVLKQWNRLDSAVQKDMPNRISTLLRQNASRSTATETEKQLRILSSLDDNANETASDYGDSWPDDNDDPLNVYPGGKPERSAATKGMAFPEPKITGGEDSEAIVLSNHGDEQYFGETDSMLEAAIVGLADSQDLHASRVIEQGEIQHAQCYQNGVEETHVFPATPKQPLIKKHKVILSSDSSDTALEPSHRRSATQNPSAKSSSPFFAVTHTEKHSALVGKKERSAFFKESKGQNERAPKRLKLTADVNLQNNLLVSATSSLESVELKPDEASEAIMASPEPEGADEWLMQEFGQYVDFI